jgi:hypothetical protein
MSFPRAVYLVAGVVGLALSVLLMLSIWFLPVGVVGIVLSICSLRAARAPALGPTPRGRAVAATAAFVALFGWWLIVATLNAQVGVRAWESREYLPWMVVIGLMTVTALVYLTRERAP